MARTVSSSTPHGRSFLFERWPRFASRHPRPVAAAALAAVVAFGALFVLFGGRFGESFNLPGTQSERLIDLLEERFPETAGDSATVVVRSPEGIEADRGRVEALIVELDALPEVVSVSSPYEQPWAISRDGSIARISVQYRKQAFALEKASTDALLDLRRER